MAATCGCRDFPVRYRRFGFAGARPKGRNVGSPVRIGSTASARPRHRRRAAAPPYRNVRRGRCGAYSWRADRPPSQSKFAVYKYLNKMCQTACKPGSVPACAGDDHSSGTPLAERLARPTRTAAWKPACRTRARRAVPIWSCSRWGLPCRLRYRRRGALLPLRFTLAGLARANPGLAVAVSSLWHCPWGRPRRVLPGTAFPWSPDFPPLHSHAKAAIRPSGGA